MKNMCPDQLPPEIAQQIHPDRRKNEADYWSAREKLLEQYRGQWIGFAQGRVIASGTSPVSVFHAAETTGCTRFLFAWARKRSRAASGVPALLTTSLRR